MDRKLYLNDLYDYYGELLTDKQKAYFEDYYFQDFSLSEIAEKYSVSRNAIYHQLRIVEEKLEEYENVLQLYEKKGKILSLLTMVEHDDIKKKIEELI